MAIKVQNTEVISDTRTLNFTGGEGVYDDLKMGVTVSSSGLSGTTPLSFYQATDGLRSAKSYWAGLGGDATFQIQTSTTAAGRTLALFVDATSSGHDQTFTAPSGTILWPEDTEPDFATARYWAHYITCWDSSTVSILSTSWATV